MSQPKEPLFLTGRDLGAAICKHFGLDPEKVSCDHSISTVPNTLASVNLSITLTADDLAGIARCAGANSGNYHHHGGLAFVDPGKDELVVTRLEGESGPELVSFSQPGVIYGADNLQALTLKVDADEAVAAIRAATENMAQQLRDGVSALRDIAGNASAEMVKGEALALDPDPRLDEIVSLLKRIASLAEKEWLCSRVSLVEYDTVHVAGGGPGGMSSSSQSGPNAGHWHPDAKS